MIRLARVSIRRPKSALLAWILVAAALSAVGFGVSDALSPSVTTVAGTQSARAEELAASGFGPSVLVPVLLEGPADTLNRQGPALVRVLAGRPDTRVLSAWDGGDAAKALRPRPGAAMVLVAVARSQAAMVDHVQGDLEGTVDRVVAAPVRASVTGTAAIDRAMRDEAIDTTRRAMALTLPILFVVLLVLLRAPLVALALALLGAATTFTSFGAMTLLGELVAVDATAVATASMVGLALGVGYGLLLYRRWRAELVADDRHDAAQAAATAVATTGRAVLVGGTALVVALLLAPMIADTEILTSIGIGSLLCSALAVGAAVVVMPAFLVLAGRHHELAAFPAPGFVLRIWERLAGAGNGVVRSAVPAGALATAVLAALAIPALSLQTGPPSAALLPRDDPARLAFERVADVMGPGWPTPFNIVVASKDRPITDAKLLKALDAFQAGLARDPRVASVAGPGVFAATSTDLNVLPKQLKDSAKLLKGGKKDLGRLQEGLGQAGSGAGKLRSGLSSAASGAGRLQSGSGSAQSGAGQLRAGLDKARGGATQISAGLATALDAARRLRDGAGTALSGAGQISSNLKTASGAVSGGLPIVKKMAGDVAGARDAVAGAASNAGTLAAQLDDAAAQVSALPDSQGRSAALGALQSARSTAGGLAGTLQASASSLQGSAGVAAAFSAQVAELSSGLGKLYAGSQALQRGIGQLQDGNSRLAAGIAKLSGGGGQLTSGVGALRDGAAKLESGLAQLSGGAGQLASGLSAGTEPTGKLVSGLGRLERGVAKFRGQLPSTKDLERLQRESPGLFESGYFVLAAIQGAPAAQRTQASFAVNLDAGGTAGQITVISRTGLASDDTAALGAELRDRAQRFAATSGAEVAVGGPAGSLGEFESATAERIAPLVLITAAVVALLMMVLLRAVLLPLVAVAFDLLTCAATFGVLALLFGGDDPVLGGPGRLDPMTIIGIFSVVFGLTMVYEVHLLHRTREALASSGDAVGALRNGLYETAAAGTGAALVMVAAIVPFATTELATVRAFGVGVAIAVLLDAVIVRPVLLPAAARVLGRRGWWPTGRQPLVLPEDLLAQPPGGAPADHDHLGGAVA